MSIAELQIKKKQLGVRNTCFNDGTTRSIGHHLNLIFQGKIMAWHQRKWSVIIHDSGIRLNDTYNYQMEVGNIFIKNHFWIKNKFLGESKVKVVIFHSAWSVLKGAFIKMFKHINGML